MKALWRSDLDQGKHDPLEIVSVVTKTGSSISAALIVPLDPHAQPIRIEVPGGDDAGLLDVIQAQLEAIDELSKAPAAPALEGDDAKELKHLREWGEQFPLLLENLCEAMGLPRQPVGPTGIPELDIILDLAR